VGDDIFIIFMIKRGDVFFHENYIFMKKWTGDDFRLMTRVLPRPLVLQGGKSMRTNTRNRTEENLERTIDFLPIRFLVFVLIDLGPGKARGSGGAPGGGRRGGG
jgi:hypothetical protein